ncbi:AraC family transcriptional regulator [Cellulomonas sp. KRMCY2]|uniref:helix-turn-helix domain-containing protein n=1 Tax=Cellulomonas sp. KRMCY2 TaxID=1304865 RepID=UPI00045E5A93|nr:helix-turn-helix domain-containing protein [Cellulomonas sp. KRMCY2]
MAAESGGTRGSGTDEELVYRRRPPPSGSEDLIEHLWVVRAPASDIPRREVLIPNGRPVVAVPLARAGVRIDVRTGRGRPNDGLVSGVAVDPVVLVQRGPSWYIGAQLTPTAVVRLTGSDPLVDAVAPASDVLGVLHLVDRLRAAQDPLALLATMILAQAARTGVAVPVARAAAVRAAVARADAERGMVTAVELARTAAVAPSTLRRWFLHDVGVGPKAFLAIIRFYHFVGELIAPDQVGTVATLAALQGYADASHAAREVRRFSGLAPGDLRRRQHGIAALMHAPGSGDHGATQHPRDLSAPGHGDPS